MRRSAVAALTLGAVGALGLAATGDSFAGTPAAPPLDDPTIVAIFDAANTADIETGSLAAERGQSREVREFGAMLAHDHQYVRQLGRDLARKLNVTPTPPAQDLERKLGGTSSASQK